jgi:hypothetical protein
VEGVCVVGLDLGQAQDPSAVAVVKREPKAGGDPFGADTDTFRVGHCERLPQGMPYPEMIGYVRWLLRALPKGTELVVDATGVGKPVIDLLATAGLEPIGVTITAGGAQTGSGMLFNVPKLTLVSGLQVLLHEGRLAVSRDVPEAKALLDELRTFRVNFTAAGHMQFAARKGAHDDLVTALSLAIWRARADIGSDALSVLNFYRAQAAQERRPEGPPKGEDERLPWHGPPAPPPGAEGDDLMAVHRVYLDALSGLSPAAGVLCDTCGFPLSNTRHTDGVHAWHPRCRPPAPEPEPKAPSGAGSDGDR